MLPPCRLFVIPARDASVAAIIRCDPSRWYQVIRWDTSTDELTNGSWFKGRIYEERCDLSPDGELFVYFCHGRGVRPGYTDSWTAVSRLPWMHALALWPAETTYGGGGRFVGRRKLVLRNSQTDKPHQDFLPTGLDLVDEAAPYHASTGEVDGAEWSGYDHDRKIIFARDGKLFRRVDDRDEEIVDLNDRIPKPAAAPRWATRPIG